MVQARSKFLVSVLSVLFASLRIGAGKLSMRTVSMSHVLRLGQ